jgi:hypothetical protein
MKQVSGGVTTTTIPPTLHYIVIKGIFEESSGGIRHFDVHDPDTYTNSTDSEAGLRTLIAMPDNAPVWVYDYGSQTTGSVNPAYILMVQGD